MTQEIPKQACINAARQIADKLIAKAEHDEHGIYWKSFTLGDRVNGGWETNDTLYSGTSGIALFILEAWHVTGEASYLETAGKAMSWVYHDNMSKKEGSLAIYTGRLSNALVFIRYADLTGKKEWYQKALDICEIAKNHDIPCHADDLLNGRVGIVLGLAHLHAKTGQAWLLDAMEHHFNLVLEAASIAKEGLYWDRNATVIAGLCGFSHGVAGMAFAFLELGYYLENPALYELARQAFAYENEKYIPKHNAWPDFRKGIYSEEDLQEFTEEYQKDNFNFFTQPGLMSAWCHGAPGISLSRLRAMELLDGAYREDFDRATENYRARFKRLEEHIGTQANFTLCHGLTGDWEQLILASQQLGNQDYVLELIPQVEKTLAYLATGEKVYSGFRLLDVNDECTSLFMGVAGVGYMMLRLAEPEKVPSILAPILQEVNQHNIDPSKYPNLFIDQKGIWRRQINKAFLRSLAYASQTHAHEVQAFFDGHQEGANPLVAFQDFVTALENKDEKLNEIFKLEQTLYDIDTNIVSLSLLNFTQVIHVEQMKTQAELTPETELKLAEDIQFMETQWNWTEAQGIPEAKEEEEVIVMMKPMVKHPLETTLTTFSAMILQSFKEGAKVSEVVQKVLNAFELTDEGQKEQVRQLSMQQVREALNSGILCYP